MSKLLQWAVLIESDWNLKCQGDESGAVCRSCINRIRLEFKVASTFGLVRFCEGINRIRLEFKDYTEGFEYVDNAVLIESDWNLKEVKPVGASETYQY